MLAPPKTGADPPHERPLVPQDQRGAWSPDPDTTTVETEVERIGLGAFHYTAAVICGLGNASDAVELLAIGYIIPQLPGVGDNEKAVLSAAVFVGMLVGGIICGFLGDKLGRRPCLLYSLALNAAFGLASAFAPSWGWLVVFRVLAGLGVGGSVPSVFTLFTEYLPVHRRGGMLTIVAWFWMVGSIYAAGVAWIVLGYLQHSWRVFAILAAIPSSSAFLLTLCVLPESPRYYANHRQVRKAGKVLAIMARRNGQPAVSQRLVLSASNLAKPEPVSKLFHPKIRRTTVLLIVIWFTLSFGWYGLILWIPSLFKQVNFNLNPYQDSFMVAAANLPGNIVSTLVMDSLGRKRVLGYSMGISAVFAILFAFSTTAWMTVATACILNAVSIAGWNALDCLSAESFPTSLRSSAMGVLAAFGRIGSIAGQFVFGALISVSVHALLAVAAVMLVIGSGSALLLPHEPSNEALAERVGDDESDDEFRATAKRDGSGYLDDGTSAGVALAGHRA